jgi:electron transport complex protein RnfE
MNMSNFTGFRETVMFQGWLLGGATLLAASLLGGGDMFTRDDIKLRIEEDLKASIEQVIPPALHDNDLLKNTLSINNASGETVLAYRATREGRVTGIAFTVTTLQGYSGRIEAIIGVNPAGHILGVRILSHAETPGLGDKIEVLKDDWILGFNGLSLSNPAPDKWAVRKDGGKFDQFSGATITPRAVIAAVKSGLVIGLWTDNIVFSQMLALCPLLAVTGTATNGLGMGMVTTVVLVLSGLLVSLLRQQITPQVRIPTFILIIATIVTLVDMSMNAWVHELYKVLGLFIPLIVTNCAILGRAESFASRNGVIASIFDGLMMGAGFTLVLVLLGGVREILGSGTLFANAAILLGQQFAFLETVIIPDYRGFLLFILPPGGFIALGFILAGKRIIDRRIEEAHKAVRQRSAETEARP